LDTAVCRALEVDREEPREVYGVSVKEMIVTRGLTSD
jgi:hypothetical protein